MGDRLDEMLDKYDESSARLATTKAEGERKQLERQEARRAIRDTSIVPILKMIANRLTARGHRSFVEEGAGSGVRITLRKKDQRGGDAAYLDFASTSKPSR